jgi:GDPmannose 4,6-dehydratase
MSKTALISGITGQDGSYLADLLLDKGYEVHGIVRRNSVPQNQTSRIEYLLDYITLHYGDVTDISSLISIINKCKPDEIYNLAAQSHVRISFDNPILTANIDALGALNMLEAVRITNPKTKLYQASSSEMFGNNIDSDGYQRETTPMNPVSPYGCSKVFAYNISRNYRIAYDMRIWNGILFNHESPRRGINFVTNKVVHGSVSIKKGLSSKLYLGNIDASRDWGHAKDYVRAMWMMLNYSDPDDFVCSTGETRTVRDLCEYVFNKLDLNYLDYIAVDPKYYRPQELHSLKGDNSKLVNSIGWVPEYTFEEMLDEMIEYWMK